jgi:hypothetical protein
MRAVTRGIVFLLVALATPVIYGTNPSLGVGGVDVIVKQRPRDRAVTDGRGNFAIEALAAGSYTLTFRARKAEDLHHTTPDKVMVASTYSINIEGAKRAVTASGLTSNDLMNGYDVDVDLAAGARVHGQVVAGALKKMVWIQAEPGSRIPGHWVEADSAEARAARHYNVVGMSVEDMQKRR